MNRTYHYAAIFAALGFAAAAHAANEVKLIDAASTYQAYYIGFNQTHFEALVANLGATKVVNAHVRLSDGTWTDIPLSYNRAADNGREVWIGDVSDYGGLSRFGNAVVFALSYSVNGQTYWDNNNGANYTVANNSGVLLYGLNVYNRYGFNYYYGSTVSGVVTLRNLAPTKQVTVVYSTDGWATTQSAAAVYNANYWTQNYITLTNPSPAGFEEWTYSLPVGTSATHVDFAISYTVNGQTYWDNNFGHNYSYSWGR